MFWTIAIGIGIILYFVILLFFFSLMHASKRGDEILSENELINTETLPKASMPLFSSKSLEEAMETLQKMLDNDENQDPPIAQPENSKIRSSFS